MTVRLKTYSKWFFRRPGWRVLVGRDAGNLPDSSWRWAWLELMLLSLAWGGVNVAVWSIAWGLFGEPAGLLLPATAVTVASLLGPYRRAAEALGRLCFGEDRAARSLLAAAVLVVMVVSLASLRPHDYRLDAPLPDVLAWIRPWTKSYRVLLLMPLWGGWATLAASQFCRPWRLGHWAENFSRRTGPVKVAAVMAALLALTITYFNFLPWEQLSISAITAAAAIASGWLLCRLAGRLDEAVFSAVNLVTQILFLLTYLAARNLLSW